MAEVGLYRQWDQVLVLCSRQELVPIAENGQEHDSIATSLSLVKLNHSYWNHELVRAIELLWHRSRSISRAALKFREVVVEYFGAISKQA